MKLINPTRVLLALAILLVAAIGYFGFGSARTQWLCKQRKAAFDARVEQIRHDAATQMAVGAAKDRVARFFQQNGIAPHYDKIQDKNEVRGALIVQGMKECGSLVCNSDAVQIVVEVEVDETGKVTAQPRVATIYTECL